MLKIRINDLARELEVKSKAILDVLPLVGVTEKKTHSSSIEPDEAERVKEHFRSQDAQAATTKTTRSGGRAEPEGIKTKIDLSHISKPGDVLKAITQQHAAASPPVARPVPPAQRPPAVHDAPAPAPPAAAIIAPPVSAPKFLRLHQQR